MKQKVSVITVNYNMRDGLKRTMHSVLSQDYPELEYIVVDGGSTDGSIDLIRAHVLQLACCISEPDWGRYDAMNKGVRAATGDWVLFMNAGDVFYDSHVVSDVFSADRSTASLIFGHSVRWYPKERMKRLVRCGSAAALPLRMEFSHQSLFTRRRALLTHPFSLDLQIIADAEFVIRMRLEGARFEKVDRVISIFEMDGISDRRRRQSLREHWIVLSRLGLLSMPLRLKFAAMAARSLAGGMLRHVLPASLSRRLLELGQ